MRQQLRSADVVVVGLGAAGGVEEKNPEPKENLRAIVGRPRDPSGPQVDHRFPHFAGTRPPSSDDRVMSAAFRAVQAMDPPTRG